MLWQSKCLSHALCTSRVDEAFFATFSKHDKLSNYVEHWKSCMKNTNTLKVDFEQFLSAISTLSFPNVGKFDHANRFSHSMDDIKKIALDLSHNVGTVEEIVVNGSEAKNICSYGKEISSLQGLPFFLVSFHTALDL
ncbi:hypothetical protein E3N88_23566 [Mikania micrantha]|uniref:Uncharacterized protein n=1 Tax=Mikania micrantha TaxID=192012 RepID=A0A5N6NG68_9ASTR|nr:hypothetical protein E3N88_23566 [Mikania micrantha]